MRFFIIIIVFISFHACDKNCPPDEKIGVVQFTGNTSDYLPYNGSEILLYKNSAGDTLTLRAKNGVDSSVNKLCVETICTENNFAGTSTCRYFEGDSRRIILENDSLEILVDILIYTKVYNSQKEEFADLLRVSLSHGPPSNTAEVLVGQHFEGEPDPARINILFPFSGIDFIEFNNIIYNNVLFSNGEQLTFYYKENIGLLAFEKEDILWVLQ